METNTDHYAVEYLKGMDVGEVVTVVTPDMDPTCNEIRRTEDGWEVYNAFCECGSIEFEELEREVTELV